MSEIKKKPIVTMFGNIKFTYKYNGEILFEGDTIVIFNSNGERVKCTLNNKEDLEAIIQIYTTNIIDGDFQIITTIINDNSEKSIDTRNRPNTYDENINSRLTQIKNKNIEAWLTLDTTEKLNLMGDLYTISPLSVYNLYAMKIAKFLDEDYENNIRSEKLVWIINALTGEHCFIVQKEIDDEMWHNLINNYACFRNEIDLIVCKKILKEFAKDVWRGSPRRK